jgi:hypothetical protein
LGAVSISASGTPSPLVHHRTEREAQSTSALEGTYAPFADVLAADRDDAENLTAEIHEVLNFESMAELAFLVRRSPTDGWDAP